MLEEGTYLLGLSCVPWEQARWQGHYAFIFMQLVLSSLNQSLDLP